MAAKKNKKFDVVDGGGGGDDAHVRFGGGGGSNDPPATRAWVNEQMKAVTDALSKRMDERRNQVIGAIIAAAVAVIGAGAWGFGVLREDVRSAQANAQRDADRIEGRLEQALSRDE
jgi:hypothetical protein